MCKGISLVLTKNDCYWADDNSHETVKKENNLRDNNADNLLIVELFPRGKKFLSENHNDWEIVFENKTSWFIGNEHEITDRIYGYLFSVVFAKVRETGIKKLDLSYLKYTELPDFENIKIGNVDCSNNKLTSLSLPNAKGDVDCHNNKLTSLSLPNATGYVYCYNNEKDFTKKDWKK